MIVCDMRLFASLNPEQRTAVAAPPGPILVRAGAGSGKTRVLTLRIAYLIVEHGVSPSNILALTFTNKAAREMRQRLRDMPGVSIRGLTAGTFHSVCASVLREHIAGRIGSYTADFTIYAEDEQVHLASAALDAARERPPALLEPEELLRHISRAKSRLLTPRLAARFARDDLAQHALVELLTRPSPANGGVRSLFAVGDGMQAIYGFRNADHTIISRFERDFPDARVIELATNYRSRQPILDAAYAVIRHSRTVQPMALRATKPEPPRGVGYASPLQIVDAKDARDEAERVARSIADLLRQGRRPQEIAVLYRSRHMSRAFESALRHARIPYALRGATGFFDRAVVRDALAYLRVINNPADTLSLNRIANVPPRGLGANSLATLSAFAGQRGLTLADALIHPEALALLPSKAAEGARQLAALLTRWRRLAESAMSPDHLLADVLERTGYQAWLEQRLEPENVPDARAHLQELANAAADHTALNAFLQEVALLTSADDNDEERDRVQLSTIHAAKGLEWPIVFVVGLEEGVLPHEHSLVTPEGVDEERRLCYVALTRAGEQLYLSWAASRVRGKPAKPSRFLNDIEAYGRERAKLKV